MKIFLFFSILFFSLFGQAQSGASSSSQSYDSLSALPVQDGGRIKPLDTFAREHLFLIHGRESFEKRPALEIVMTWVLQPDAWREKELFEIRESQLREALKLDSQKIYYSIEQLSKNERLGMIMQDLASHRETKEKLNPYYQSVQRLENQLYTFREIAAGRMLKLVPPKEGSTWLALSDLTEMQMAGFVKITQGFVAQLGVAMNVSAPDAEVEAAKSSMKESVNQFAEMARAENPNLYPEAQLMKLEVHYNSFHPFRWTYALYLLAALSLLLSWLLDKKILYRGGWTLVLLALLLNIYGFALRVYLTGRPPVSNMYETTVWVGFGAVVFACIIEMIYRWRFILFAGALVGALCLALGDMAPVVLDDSLQPLEPVLRSQFWLIVHVLTITISYAAFFLAFVLGDIGLIYYLKGEQQHREKIKAIVLSLTRAMQMGVAFLAPGIILGGIWADYSWGRFWGWDPKETWAFIALVGYIAVLHGKIGGIIKDFGMVCASVLTFSLVIMAWYGVNYILGAGLHSYGFGAGGVEYVSGFVAIQILLIIFVAIIHRDRRAKAA